MIFLVRIPKNALNFSAPCEGLWFFSPFASEGRGGGEGGLFMYDETESPYSNNGITVNDILKYSVKLI